MAFEDFNDYEDSLLDDPVDVEYEQDVIDEDDPNEDEESYEDYEDNSDVSDDMVESILLSRGINPNAIKIKTDNGIEEVSFYDLTREELLDILGDLEVTIDDSSKLEDDEINLLNVLRLNNWSTLEYNNYIANLAVLNYINSQNAQTFTVDDYSDEELFVADLQSRIPDITEDEALEELQNAKSNLSVFERKVLSIRNDYRQKESMERALTLQKQEEERASQFKQFQDTILNTIEANRELNLGGLPMEMSSDDMNTVASFILDTDQAGVRHIAKALQDPNAVVQMAWWLTKGQDAFREMNNYYKQQIAQIAKNNYTRGFEEARNSTGKAVVRKHSRSQSITNDGDLWDKFI